MEERDKKAICLMLNVNFDSGVDISTILEDEDVDTYERDPHITVFYGPPAQPIDYKEIMGDIQEILDEDYYDFTEFLKKEEDMKTSEVFELGNFENPDNDFLVLKLLDGNIISNTLRLLQKSLTKKYDILLSFSVYRPHMTLAKMKSGSSMKYLNDECLKKYLDYSTVSFEDFVYSEGYETEKWKKYCLTNYHIVDRHFRLQDQEKACKNNDLRWE